MCIQIPAEDTAYNEVMINEFYLKERLFYHKYFFRSVQCCFFFPKLMQGVENGVYVEYKQLEY